MVVAEPASRRVIVRASVLPNAREVLGSLGVPASVVTFLVGLAQEKRLSMLPDIARVGLDQYAVQGTAGIIVATTQAPSTAQQALGERVAFLADTVVSQYESDPLLLGGIRISVGSRTVDRSLVTRLADLERTLTRPSV